MSDLIQESAQVMKKCQAGTNNYDKANNLHAECYGTIGALLHEIERLRSEVAELKAERDRPTGAGK